MHDTDTLALSDECADEDTEVLPSAYKRYVDSLSKHAPLDDAQRARLHAEHSPLLWVDACKLVLYAYRAQRAQGMLPYTRLDDMDMIQEANLAAGRALESWDPCKGKLSTWLWPHIRFALLRHALEEREHTGKGRASMDEWIGAEELAEAQDTPGMEQEEPIRLEDELVYDHHVFDAPEAAAVHAELIERINAMCSEDFAELAVDFLFRDYKVTELADKYEVSVPTIYNRLRKLRTLPI